MSVEVKVPVLPESVSEATLVSWHKSEGDAVNRDENLVDLETEKVVLEVPSPVDGVIKEIKKADGDTVVADELLAIIEAGAVATTDSATETPSEETESAPPQKTEVKTSPAVRNLLEEHKLDPGDIKATGKDGRLLKEDVLKHLDELKQASEASSEPNEPQIPTPSTVAGERTEKREQMTRLRATIAARLKDAQNTAAMLTTFNDVSLQAVIDLRKTYKQAFEEKHGARLGFMSFFVKASVEALKRYPIVNAYVDGNDIVYHNFHDIGIAAASPRGLVVPIVRDANRKSFAEIEIEISQLGKKAKEGKLAMEELTGGTFTITNGGIFGSMLSTPILNPPQSAILGMHRIEERPVAENGEVVIRPMMYLALSYDHRIIDGAEAVRFLVTVKECLEDPARLLLQV